MHLESGFGDQGFRLSDLLSIAKCFACSVFLVPPHLRGDRRSSQEFQASRNSINLD